MMNYKHALFIPALLMVATLFTPGLASVGWEIKKKLQMERSPRDVAVSHNGKWIFVLNDQGSILVYSADGTLNDTIHIPGHIDQVEVGPREDILLLSSRQKKTLQVLWLEFSRNIEIAGSPFKGPVDAPVVIVVFNDFE